VGLSGFPYVCPTSFVIPPALFSLRRQPCFSATLRTSASRRASARLFVNSLSPSFHASLADSTIEWAYAFDVHTNSFFPFYRTLYVAQLILLPIVTKDKWVLVAPSTAQDDVPLPRAYPPPHRQLRSIPLRRAPRTVRKPILSSPPTSGSRLQQPCRFLYAPRSFSLRCGHRLPVVSYLCSGAISQTISCDTLPPVTVFFCSPSASPFESRHRINLHAPSPLPTTMPITQAHVEKVRFPGTRCIARPRQPVFLRS
jgi:hypothetical protein